MATTCGNYNSGAKISGNRAEGIRDCARVNPSAALSSEPFIPKTAPDAPMSIDDMERKAADRGFTDADSEAAGYILGRVSYQHISEYFHVFDKASCDVKRSFRWLSRMMLLDRKYQSILTEYIGLVELQLRARYSYEMSSRFGAFAHRNPKLFKNLTHYAAFMHEYERVQGQCQRRRSSRAARDIAKFGDMPIWEAVEEMPFGMLSKLYSNTRSQVAREAVAESFGEECGTLESWLGTLTFVRNRCAHYGKLLGANLPVMPKKMSYVDASNASPFYVALVLMRLLRTNQHYNDLTLLHSVTLAVELHKLFSNFSPILECMGIPADWEQLMCNPDVSGIGLTIKHGRPPESPEDDSDDWPATRLQLKST